MGKNLNQRLLSLAAKPFYEPGFADDGTGLVCLLLLLLLLLLLRLFIYLD